VGDRPACELWRSAPPIAGRTAALARRCEDEGWDGLALNDSPSRTADPFVEIALSLSHTERLRFATAVTNPVMRHVAALGSTLAALHIESGGRVHVGIGRGDSALANLGMAPVRLAPFESYLTALQRLLAGEEIPFATARRIGTTGAAASITGTRLHWLSRVTDRSKPLVEVAASGPKVAAIGARVGDRVKLAVGVDPVRITAALEWMGGSGGALPSVPFALNVPIFVHPDRASARRAIAGVVSATARFAAMSAATSAPADGSGAGRLSSVAASYDMDHHGSTTSPQALGLSDDTIDRFAVTGSPAECIEKLQALIELGPARLHLRSGGVGVDAEANADAARRLSNDVLPNLR